MNPMKIASISLLFLMCIFSCKEKSFQEKESNDSFSSANLVQVEENIQGYFQSPDDADFYKFSVSGQAVLDISLGPVKGINHAFKIWKGEEAPELLKWVDDSRKSSPERLVNLHVKPGVYYIEVLQSDRDVKKTSDIPYQLIIKARPPQLEEQEPNDGPDQATQLVPGSEISGYFSPGLNRISSHEKFAGRESDWYALELRPAEGSPLILKAVLGPVPGVNSMLYLFGPDMTELAFSDSEGIGKGEVLNDIGISKPGRYFLAVTTRGIQTNNEVPYALNVVLKDFDPAREMENNGDFDRANLIRKSEITGSINFPGDRDFFLSKAEEGTQYRVELRPAREQDLQMVIYNSSKKRIHAINNEGRGGREILPDFSPGEDFYVEVTARDQSTQPGDYHLSVTPLVKSASLEKEPNDSRQQANVVQGKEIIGYTSFKGDRDFFLIERTGRARMQCSATGPAEGEIRLSITDSQGFVIKSTTIRGKKSVLLTEMIDGRGYVIVDSLREDYDNTYIIRISEKQ